MAIAAGGSVRGRGGAPGSCGRKTTRRGAKSARTGRAPPAAPGALAGRGRRASAGQRRGGGPGLCAARIPPWRPHLSDRRVAPRGRARGSRRAPGSSREEVCGELAAPQRPPRAAVRDERERDTTCPVLGARLATRGRPVDDWPPSRAPAASSAARPSPGYRASRGAGLRESTSLRRDVTIRAPGPRPLATGLATVSCGCRRAPPRVRQSSPAGAGPAPGRSEGGPGGPHGCCKRI
uniref:translation initiation factor IF-2-like n=1 Tax=Nyctereutes procyonoides TaxID=34880 RepID=UPI00244450C8|nr:translation initiation factor IF-2-like [Nyctereutes procyonoides]